VDRHVELAKSRRHALCGHCAFVSSDPDRRTRGVIEEELQERIDRYKRLLDVTFDRAVRDV